MSEAYWQKLAIEQEHRLDVMQSQLNALQARVSCVEFSTTRQTAQAAGLEKRTQRLEAEVYPQASRDDPIGQRPRLLAGIEKRHDVLRTTVDLLSAKVQALADRPVEGLVFYGGARGGGKRFKLDAKSLAMRKALDEMLVRQGPFIWYNEQAPVSEKAWKNLEPVHDWEGPTWDTNVWSDRRLMVRRNPARINFGNSKRRMLKDRRKG